MTISDDQLQFIDYRKPKLEAGDYRLSGEHQYGPSQAREASTDNLLLRVTGERVAINHQDIFACYPPPGESGDFSDTLPHISFKKGTLPWIRSAYDKDDDSDSPVGEIYEPWLYLLVANELDITLEQMTPVADCALADLDKGAYFPKGQKQSLLNDTSVNHLASVKTIEIRASLFRKLLLPDSISHDKGKDQLETLAHIRRRWTPQAEPVRLSETQVKALDKGQLPNASALALPVTVSRVDVLAQGRSWVLPDSINGDLLLDRVSHDDSGFLVQKMSLKRELSVLLANRLGRNDPASPDTAIENTALVVSLEQYLTESVLAEINQLADDNWLRLIVLTSWDFSSKAEKINFEQRAKALDVNALKLSDKEITQFSDVAARLEAGQVALEHQFRQGARSVSWYRGPFSPVALDNIARLVLTGKQMGRIGNVYSASDADKLLQYYNDDGMLDISYSSAYELGRLLAFKDKTFSQLLANYKRDKSRYIKLIQGDEERQQQAQDIGIDVNTLPYARVTDQAINESFDEIVNWLVDFCQLKDIPLWYVLPDEKLLPKRSLRIFHLDGKWLQSAMLGALSLHGRPKITYELLRQAYAQVKATIPVQGALLRSDIVWAYPQIQTVFRNLERQDIKQALDLVAFRSEKADEYTDYIESFSPIKILQERLLDNDCMLYFTEKAFDYVSLALPPESLHYGLDVDVENPQASVTKSIKFRGQTLLPDHPMSMTDKSLGIVNMAQFAVGLPDAFERRIESLQLELSAYKHALEGTSDTEKRDALTVSINALNTYIDSLSDYLKEKPEFNSAKIGRFMLEGEPQAEFTVGVEKPGTGA